MSAINKIPRGLRVLVTMAILAVLIWQFASHTVFYPGAIGAAVLITLGVIYILYRKPRIISDNNAQKRKKNQPESSEDGELPSEVPENNLEIANVNSDNIPIEEDFTDSPSSQRKGRTVEAFRSVTQKPKGTDVAANYMRMAKLSIESEKDNSITWKPAPKNTQYEDAEPVVQEPTDEQPENKVDDSTGEPPVPLIEDESELTGEEKNELENAVWYRCENPYCKFTRFLGVHHIVDEKDGGTNKLDNLIVLCPYCHDLAHRNEIPETEMRSWVSNREERFKFKPEWHHF